MTTPSVTSESASSSPRRPIIIGSAVLLIFACFVAGAIGAFFLLRDRLTSSTEPAVAYILDTSPRMSNSAEQGTRLSIAQAILAEIVRPADPELTSGLRIFGSGALSQSCEDTELVVPFAPANQSTIADELIGLTIGGSLESALAQAMIAAIRDLNAAEGPHFMVVVTGGVDSCNPQAGELVASEADRASIELQTFVVGFQVSEQDAEALKTMAEQVAGGTYHNAPDAASLRTVLKMIQDRIHQAYTIGDATPPDPAPAGDYGDAPEGGPTNYASLFAQIGQFPTLFSSDGARTLIVDEAYLGSAASSEAGANDPADPDGVPNLTNADSDDGIVDFFITLTSIPPPTTLTVEVTAPGGSPGGTYYLNAIIDLNMDGEWGGQGANGELEWVVQNQAVQVTPGATTPFTSPPFGFANGNLLPDGAFMRIALTKEMVPANWDGTGEFSSGEIEDHFIELPKKEGKRLPILTVDCNGPYAPGAPVTCIVTNSGGAGTFTYSLRRIGAGGVNVPLPTCRTGPGETPGGPVSIDVGPPGAGPGPNPVTITCQSTPGEAPDTWKLTTQVVDPPAVVVDGGVQAGASAESEADFDFEGEPKVMHAYTNYSLGNWIHYSGISHIWYQFHIVYDDPIPVPNATVNVTMTNEGGQTQSGTSITGPDGIAAGWFTISSYDTYTITVDNIEGENIIYDPSLNEMEPLVFEVGPEEGELPVVSEPMLEAFVEGIAIAVRDKETDWLIEILDPAVYDRYGYPACQTYIEGLDDSTFSIRMIEFTGPEPWQWVRDDQSTDIDRAYTIMANVTSQGETTLQELHVSIDMFGLLYWFTDCGGPDA
jgi:hypothetical protein